MKLCLWTYTIYPLLPCDIPLVARHFYHHSSNHCSSHMCIVFTCGSLGWAQLNETEMQGCMGSHWSGGYHCPLELSSHASLMEGTCV